MLIHQNQTEFKSITQLAQEDVDGFQIQSLQELDTCRLYRQLNKWKVS